MLNLQTPGVYIREVEVPQPPLLRMSITGFVGQAERGPLNSPQRIENLGQFRDIFGDLVGHSYLPYSIFGFFLNGGERCHVVRVAHESAVCATLAKPADTSISFTAINEGSWGNSVAVQIDSHSTRDILLTELETAVAINGTEAKFKSVAGLAAGDSIMLVHPRDPTRERVTISAIDVGTRKVTIARAPTGQSVFPPDSGVVGRGFRLIFRFRPSGRLVREEVFDNLSMNSASSSYFLDVINGDPQLDSYVARIQNGNSILVRVELRPSPNPPARPKKADEQMMTKGEDDPSLVTVEYFTGYERHAEKYFRPVPPKADVDEQRAAGERLNGLAAFELVNEIGLIAIPDLIVPDFFQKIPAAQIPKSGIIFARKQALALTSDKLSNLKSGQKEMLKHCERMGDRFAIIDSPRGAEAGRGKNKIEEWPSDYHLLRMARYGALYYPWIREKASDFKGLDLTLPPSGHIAGIFARSESRASVGNPPANEILRGVIEFEFCLSDGEQKILNPCGVNCLRSFPGRGLLVWGARTLSQEPDWRYVNVVRVTLATIKQILINLRWTVFEPNDRRLHDKIVVTLSIFLDGLFSSGALAGSKPSEAYFVKCDDETNPPEVIERGECITRIGLAVARPAEFVVVTIKRTSESVSMGEGLSGRS
jgi:uncharacterized protein